MSSHTTHKGERVSYDGLGSTYIAQAERRERDLARSLVGAALQKEMSRDLRLTLEAADDALAKADLARGTRGT